MGRVPLYGVLSFPIPLVYSVPDLVNSKLGWTALDVQWIVCSFHEALDVQWVVCSFHEIGDFIFLNSTVYKQAIVRGGPNPVHSCTTQHYSRF